MSQHMRLEDRPNWKELVADRNNYSLCELSEMYGATPGAITNAFARNGIRRKPQPPGPRANRNK